MDPTQELLDRIDRLSAKSPGEALEVLADLQLARCEGLAWKVLAIRGSCCRVLGLFAEAEAAFAAAILAAPAAQHSEADLCRRTARLHADRGEITAAIALAMRARELAGCPLSFAKAGVDLAAIICSSRADFHKARALVEDARPLLQEQDPYLAYAEQIDLFCWAEDPFCRAAEQNSAIERLERVGRLTDPRPGTIGFARYMWLSGVVFRRLGEFHSAREYFDQGMQTFRANLSWPQVVLCVIENIITARRLGELAAASAEVGLLFPLLGKLQERDRSEVARLLRSATKGPLSPGDLARSQHFFAMR